MGLEHPQSTHEHQEHVQRSIVVGKVQKKLVKTTDTLTCDRSLVEAIAPHETGTIFNKIHLETSFI